MKSYLNRADREHHLIMMVLWERIGAWLSKTSCLSPDERRRIKTAGTNLERASDSIIRRMDADYAKRIVRQLKNAELRVFDRDNMALRSEPDTVNIRLDDMYDLSSFALQGCIGCQRCDYKQCDRYQLFMRLDVPVATDEPEKCPYEN